MQIRTAQGLVEGFTEGGIHKFFGLPYATPPVGELRWCPPKPATAWQGVRRATAFPPICPQVIGATSPLRETRQSEDCLYVNVWTRSTEPAARQPVMFWIHGGGNLGGAGSEENCDGSRLAAKGATLVTFNYRLGAFGYLAHPQVGANFGLLDQVAALRWTQQNARVFGGDPKNITIFGESAGAVAVRALLSCPQANGLFHRAIMQSGGFEEPAFIPSWSYARAQKATEALFEQLGTRDPRQLRLTDTDAVKTASHDLCGIPPPAGQIRTPADLVWMPVVDGHHIIANETPGWPTDVPLLLGCVENEARYFLRPNLPYAPETLDIMAHSLCGPHGDRVLAQLRSHAELSPYDCMDKLMTCMVWTEPALESIRRFSALGRRLYHYHFARRSPGSVAANELAKHTTDIRYVFGNLAADGSEGYYDEVDALLSQGMQDAWLQFAQEGIRRSDSSVGSVEWPRYDPSRPETTWIGDGGIEVRPFAVTELMALVNSLRSR